MYNTDTKTRINVTIEKDLKSKLEDIAKVENRSLNNLIIHVLKSYVDKAGK